MKLEKLAEIYRCTGCGACASRLQEGALRCERCGRRCEVHGQSIHVDGAVAAESPLWRQKQSEGHERYQDQRYNEDETVARLFGGFVAVTLSRGVVLDIGSGISEAPPAYVAELELDGYVGLEPLGEVHPRSYACLAGAVAEQVPLEDRSVDAVLFATSLDHIEKVAPAYAEVKRVLRPGGRAYFWVGIYEPRVLAGIHSYAHLLFDPSIGRRVARLALVHVHLASVARQLARQAYRLRRGLPLDEKHFRYYTRESLGTELDQHGLRIERQLLVPGTNSVFVDCTVS